MTCSVNITVFKWPIFSRMVAIFDHIRYYKKIMDRNQLAQELDNSENKNENSELAIRRLLDDGGQTGRNWGAYSHKAHWCYSRLESFVF